jgi:hypothetical protein
MADVIELIQADHQRICALLDALDALRRDRGPDAATGSPDGIWRQVRGLLDLHTEAEEEICFLDLFGPGPHAADQMQEAIADHDDIRETIREADLQPAGSAAWWRSVTAVRRAASRHIVREEQQPLAAFARRAAPGRREELGRQWILFVEARVRDAPAHYGFTRATRDQERPK